MARGDSWQKRTATPEHVAAQTAKHGWFQDQLFAVEQVIHGRWTYWINALARRSIGDERIPRIHFGHAGFGDGPSWQSDTPYGFEQPRSAGIIEAIGSRAEAKANVDYVFTRAFDRGSVYLADVIEWYLFAFGSSTVKEKPKSIDGRVEVLLYCGLELHRLIAHAADWGAYVASLYYGDRAKRHTAWFPTPMSIVNLMTSMTFSEGVDYRCKTVSDPCVGTGAMLLPASNHSLRLYAQDVDRVMCLLCEWQAWLYIPWLVWSGEGVIREFREADAERENGEKAAASIVGVASPAPVARQLVAADPPRGQMLLFGADR